MLLSTYNTAYGVHMLREPKRHNSWQLITTIKFATKLIKASTLIHTERRP
jgi:hypothetical protein